MRKGNIAFARFIGTDRARPGGKGRAGAMLALFLSALPAGVACAAPPAPPPGYRVNADPVFPFSREVEAFARADIAQPPLRDATLFLGSSSIRLWDVAHSFTDIPTINRGFGGATTADVLHHYARLKPRLAPRAVVVYVGENDLAAGTSPDSVTRDLQRLLRQLRADYPRAPIAFLSLKPSPMRWTLWPKMALVNQAMGARARVDGFAYLDVGQALLAADGLPDASLFRPDGLHMNALGYQRWTTLVDAWLDRVAPPGKRS